MISLDFGRELVSAPRVDRVYFDAELREMVGHLDREDLVELLLELAEHDPDFNTGLLVRQRLEQDRPEVIPKATRVIDELAALGSPIGSLDVDELLAFEKRVRGELDPTDALTLPVYLEMAAQLEMLFIDFKVEVSLATGEGMRSLLRRVLHRAYELGQGDERWEQMYSVLRISVLSRQPIRQPLLTLEQSGASLPPGDVQAWAAYLERLLAGGRSIGTVAEIWAAEAHSAATA